MASGAPSSSMDTSVTPATRRAPSGASPPAKRWTPAQPVQNPTEQAIFDAMEDHANRLDLHHGYFKTMMQNQVDQFAKIDGRDDELRERLRKLDDLLAQLEGQVVANETRLAAAEKAVQANDTELKQNLHLSLIHI